MADRPLRCQMMEYTRKALMRLQPRGVVRKIMVQPEVWWELAEFRHSRLAESGLKNCPYENLKTGRVPGRMTNMC